MTSPPIVSRTRLSVVRAACADLIGPNGSIILILGQDGRFNAGSHAMAQYLLAGSSGRHVQDIGPQSTVIEDCIILITMETVSLYAPPSAVRALAPIIANWPDLRLYVLREEDAADVERSEHYKVRSFLDMVSSLSSTVVGIPLTAGWSGNRKRKDAPHMEVESWPIIQSFGLSDLGTGGFFTMKHAVVDVTPAFHVLYRGIDALTVTTLAQDSLLPSKHHWGLMFAILDSRTPLKRLSLTELTVLDPLFSWYEFGRIRLPDVQHSTRAPCVRFGVRTSTRPASELDDASVGEAGSAGQPACHFTVESVDPLSAIRVSRTFFLRAWVQPIIPGIRSVNASAAATSGHVLFDVDELEAEEEGRSAKPKAVQPSFVMDSDEKVLQSMYAVAVKCAEAATHARIVWTSVKDVQSALTSIVSGEWTKVSATHISSGVTPPTLSVTVDITDGFGASVLDDNPSNVRLNRRLCFISVRLIGIHSELPSRHLLGDVVYGNTFTITCQAGCSISLFSLTNNIPTFKCWAASAAEADGIASLSRALSTRSYRSPEGIIPIGITTNGRLTDAIMLTPGADPSLPDSGILTGTLDVCTHGIVFESDGMGPFPVSITRDVDRLRLLSGSDAISALGAVLPLPSSVSPAAAKQWQAVTRSWVIHHDFDDAVEAMGQSETIDVNACDVSLLVMECKPSALSFPSFTIALLLKNSSSAKRAVVSALSQWMGYVGSSPRPVASILPEPLHNSFKWYLHSTLGWVSQLCTEIESVAQLDALSLRPDLSSDTFTHSDGKLGDGDDDSVPVVVISGPIGSGRHRFLHSLTNGTASLFRWFPLSLGLESYGSDFNRESIEALLQDVARQVRASASGTGTTPRIALVSPHNAAVVDIVSAVTSVTGVSVATVVMCVHVPTATVDIRRTEWLPALKTYCYRGYSQHILLTGCDKSSPEWISHCRSMLHALNPEAVFARVHGGGGRPLSISHDVLTSIATSTNFASDRLAQLRQLSLSAFVVPVLPQASTLLSASVCFDRTKLTSFLEETTKRRHSYCSEVLNPAFEVDPTFVGRKSSESDCIVYVVKGYVRFTNDPTQVLQLTAYDGYVDCNPLETHQMVTVQRDVSQLLFVGNSSVSSGVAGLRDGALTCRPSIPPLLPHRSAADLTAVTVERSLLAQACLSLPLPEDVVFNGHYYMDFSGNTFKTHPRMGECVEAYLTAVNAKAMEFNAVRDDLVAAAALELQGSLDHASPWWTTVDIPNATQDVDTLSTLVGAAIRAVQASIEAEEKAAEEDSSDDGKYSDS